MNGRVLTFTKIHVASPAAGATPFIVAVVETPTGRLTARVSEVDGAAVDVGSAVRVETDERFGFIAAPAA